jgi:hypothetical protein
MTARKLLHRPAGETRMYSTRAIGSGSQPERIRNKRKFPEDLPSVPLFPFVPYSLDRSEFQNPIAQVDIISIQHLAALK